MFWVYILKSISKGKYYIGFSENLERRIKEHQNGNSVFDRGYRPFELVYTEEFVDKKMAVRREREIKKYKGGNQFKNLLARMPR